jgi:hypothetical protein
MEQFIKKEVDQFEGIEGGISEGVGLYAL